ncbi:GMC family oxidoreductase [Sphingomonas rosea]|uniref:GMC family oxidoreductase n=1 Tax=Sphingomonas rosea TaxID=335605 RepID=UPI0031E334FF
MGAFGGREPVSAPFEADYVIVGAGSAGCVLAARLSEDPGTSVILLEAGGDDRPGKEKGQFLSNLWIHVPIGYSQTLKDPKVNWLYQTEPDPGTDGRTHVWPRGKVLGGSSSINAMLYVRGQRADYDGWRQLGCEGWAWDDVLPYFRKAQHQARGGDALHATDGPLHVGDPADGHVVSEAAIEAAEALGLPRRDCNGPEQEGASWFQVNIKDGKRHSAAVAYLHPAMNRPNLRVLTRSLARRVLFEGKRAVGVEIDRDGARQEIRARREVILSGGAINSPQLLELAGIGDPARLQALGVPVVQVLAGVGENLQDHFVVGNTYRLKKGTISVNELARGPRLLREFARYLVAKRGLLTLSAAHIGLFVRSRPDLAGPDLQYHILPATMDAEKLANEQVMELEKEPGLTIAPCQLRPESRGSVHLKSADPAEHPAIRPNYLADPLDREVVVAGLKFGRKLAATDPLARFIDHETNPGVDVATDDELLGFARSHGTTIYHPVGTCAMGRGGAAVVDPELRVIGIKGLRVVDASIMPRLVSGNTNAPTIMIAEKAADLIRGRPALAPLS